MEVTFDSESFSEDKVSSPTNISSSPIRVRKRSTRKKQFAKSVDATGRFLPHHATSKKGWHSQSQTRNIPIRNEDEMRRSMDMAGVGKSKELLFLHSTSLSHLAPRSSTTNTNQGRRKIISNTPKSKSQQLQRCNVLASSTSHHVQVGGNKGRLGQFGRYDDAKNATFKPRISKKKGDGDSDNEGDENGGTLSFMDRQDTLITQHNNELDHMRAKMDYDAKVDKKVCSKFIFRFYLFTMPS